MIGIYVCLFVYIAVCAIGTVTVIFVKLRNKRDENGIIAIDIGDVMTYIFCILTSSILAPIWLFVQVEGIFESGLPPATQKWLDKTVIRIRVGKKKGTGGTATIPPIKNWYAVGSECMKLTFNEAAMKGGSAILVTCNECILELEHRKPLAEGTVHSCGKGDPTE